MATKNGPNSNLLVHGALGEAHYLEVTRQWRWLDFFLNPNVTSMTVTAPPGSPTDGVAYIIPAGASGAWASKTGQIARWSADLQTPAWEFMTPKEGSALVYNLADQVRYQYNGTAWIAFVSGGGGGSGDTTPIGHLGFFWETVAPEGYLLAGGGTIGNASSGGTVRANADCEALFTHFWTKGNDTNCPMYTSTGTLQTRGANAAADWAANRRMTLPDVRDDFVRGSSATNVMGTKFSDGIKAHDHGVPITGSTGGGSIARFTYSGANDGPMNLFTLSTVNAISETRPRGISLLACWKYKTVAGTGGASDPSIIWNPQTASYTPVLADANKGVEMLVASANTFTVPTNATVAFPIGTSILVYQAGAGLTTIAPFDGTVTIRKRGGGSLALAGQYGIATLIKRDTNLWVLTGDLAA